MMMSIALRFIPTLIEETDKIMNVLCLLPKVKGKADGRVVNETLASMFV